MVPKTPSFAKTRAFLLTQMRFGFLLSFFALAITVHFSPVMASDFLHLDIGNQTIHLEVAKTKAEHERGLMGRTDLAPNEGMIFLFKPAQSVSFWMKNTLIDLDIAFIDVNGIVFHTDTMRANSLTLHHSYGIAAAVVELPRGSLKRFGIRPGIRFQKLENL